MPARSSCLLLALLAAVSPLSSATLTNLSVRTTLEAQQLLTVGFTVQDGSRSLLVRAAGPSLRGFGVTNAMPDPVLGLFRDSTRVDGNDNWAGTRALTSAFQSVGAFPFDSATSADAAVLVNADGSRSAQVSGPAGGNVLVEVYDVAAGGTGRLTNLSALNRVVTGDALIAGITVGGTGSCTLLIRAVGPSLAPLGVPETLRDPLLVVRDGEGRKLEENDNFSAALNATFASAGAFPLEAGGRDSALVRTFPPGSYTVQVSGADGGTGAALIEVYELSQDVWQRTGWTRPVGSTAVANAALRSFTEYVSVVRTPDLPLAFEIQAGADPRWSEWIPKGVTLVARAFSYPKFASAYTAVAGLDRTWFVDTFTRLYGAANGQFQGTVWDTGNVAWADTNTITSNSWNLDAIRRTNQLQTNPVGMANTPGHEFFHIVQRYLAGRPTSTGPGLVMPAGAPQWFWEGPANFVGHLTANHLGFSSYLTAARPQMVSRSNALPGARLRLEQVTTNTPPASDPYGIGHLATEFLVAQVGMEGFLNVYREMAAGKAFDAAFAAATGVALADFYEMFEAARPALGIPRPE